MEWKISDSLIPYPDALAFMETRVAAIRAGEAEECIWLLEHPPLYTAGTSARSEDLLETERFDVFETGRGGQYTYHGPGQRIAYVMLDLKKRAEALGQAPDLRVFVKQLEAWIIATLAEFDVEGFTRDDRIGVWVQQDSGIGDQGSAEMTHHAGSQATSADVASHELRQQVSSREAVAQRGNEQKESKIAALGIRVKHWVTYHGIAINLNPDLSHFNGIVPCGISHYGVTSLHALGIEASMAQFDQALSNQFIRVFGTD